MMECAKLYRINPEGIGFFKAILESYEDLAIFSVLDGKVGLIELIYPVHFESDLEKIMSDMTRYGIEIKECCDV